jgi:hypothetical protein
MSTYCTCTVEVISAAGFSFRDGTAYCNHCSKPEVSSGPQREAKPARTGNLVADLFDFRLERFVSVSYFKLLYAITVILWTIVAVIAFFYILANTEYLSGGMVFLFILGIPTVYFLLLIYTRMSIELIVNFFQIGKDIKEIKESSRQQ